MSRAAQRVAVLGGGRLAFGAVSMVRVAIAGGAPFSLVGWARGDAGRAVLADAGAALVDSAEDAVRGATAVIIAVPAPSIKDVVAAAAAAAGGDQVVLHAARGTCQGFALPHEVIRRGSCWKKVVALGGPLYLDDARSSSADARQGAEARSSAEARSGADARSSADARRGAEARQGAEVRSSGGAPPRALNAAVASRFDEAIAFTRSLLRGAPIRLSATHDIVGVELCGALSNVGHLAAGLAQGAGLSETDQGLLHVRALLEASKLGRAVGADRATFSGLAGVGDLIPRRVSSQRKHKELGQQLAAGEAVNDDVTRLEGAVTAREGAPFAGRHHVDAPLLAAVAAILDGGAPAGATLARVLDLELGLRAAE